MRDRQGPRQTLWWSRLSASCGVLQAHRFGGGGQVLQLKVARECKIEGGVASSVARNSSVGRRITKELQFRPFIQIEVFREALSKLEANGALLVLHSFDCPQGQALPWGRECRPDSA